MRTATADALRGALANLAGNADHEQAVERYLARLSAGEAEFLLHDWLLWAREDQLPPTLSQGGADWTTWLILGGRGAGKTRAGAEWVRGLALGKPPFATAPVERIALVGETLGDARAVMIDGPSGLMAIHPTGEKPSYNATRRELTWPNGAVARLFSADDPESLRGPQFGAAWADEIAKWRYAQATWDMLQFCLRLGDHPRQAVTTTPRPIPLLKRLMADRATTISRTRTADNASNLAPSFLGAVVGSYEGTRLGRQELDGELIEDRPDALWQRDIIERIRIREAPPMEHIVVAVDPPVTTGPRADACGIVAAGRTENGQAVILADATVQGVQPLDWAQAAASLYQSLEADSIVAEVNQGGELVAEIIRQVVPTIPIRQVRATRGKYLRAEPVATLYQRGLVAHAGQFPELEDQMCDFGRGGLSNGASPDRLDALVWALTELMVNNWSGPRVTAL
ncbi:MAG: terminase family protein [Hyphomicrobiales bacterium]|nr:terminase family protein [Hyphomicrobiales bacterium]